MQRIRTRIHVADDHSISGVAPPSVPPGEYEVTIAVASPSVRPRKRGPFRIDDLPEHDLGPWPEGLSLRREDIYDEDGR